MNQTNATLDSTLGILVLGQDLLNMGLKPLYRLIKGPNILWTTLECPKKKG